MSRTVIRLISAAGVVTAMLTSCGDGAATSTTSLPVTQTSTSTVAPDTSTSTSTTTISPGTTPPRTRVVTTTQVTTTNALPTTTVAPQPTGPVVTFEVGPGGIEYLGGGEDLTTTGPSLIAVDPAFVIHIFDPAADRILSVGPDASTSIDLRSLDIASVTAMATSGSDLILAEVFFAPERQRLHRITADGTVLLTVDLPAGFRLEDGLSDVMAAGQGDIIIVLEDGSSYGTYDASESSFSLQTRATIHGVEIQNVGPDLSIDGILITADLTMGLGGVRYLGTATNGTHIVERSDVVATNPAFLVVRTLEWYSASGELLGSALVPGIEGQAIGEPPGVAVAEDGTAFVLIALPTTVEVWELVPEPGRILR